MTIPIYLDNGCEPIKLSLFQNALNAGFSVISGVGTWNYGTEKTVIVFYDGTPIVDSSPDYMIFRQEGCAGSTFFNLNINYGCTFAFGNCIDFDAVNDYVSIPNNAAYSFGTATDFSISFWVRWRSQPLAAQFFRFLSKSATANDRGWRIGFQNTGTWTAGILTATGNQEKLKNMTPVIGQWYHVVFVKIGTNVANWNLYLNTSTTGQSTLINTGVAQNFTNTEAIVLGRRLFPAVGSASNIPFPGRMDEVAIFNTALSALQVSEIYNAGAGACFPNALSANLVGWWRMNEALSVGGTNTANDDSVTNNDGTLINFGTRTQIGSLDPAWVAH